ncbi:MAG: thiamine phosphate synthase, partial [Acutalibacteraceae bacterium]
FQTDTKADAEVVSMQTLRRIRETVDLPNVVIGGINQKTAGQFTKEVTDGLAVVSAIIAQADIRGAAQAMRRIFEENRA